MPKADVISHALQLTEPERLALAEELWANVENLSIYRDKDALPQWQVDVLEQRLVDSQDDPGKSWTDFKAEIWPADVPSEVRDGV